MKVFFPAKSSLEAAGQKLNSDKRPCLQSDKEGRFCPYSEHFLTFSISEKFVDKLLILLNWSESKHYRAIYVSKDDRKRLEESW